MSLNIQERDLVTGELKRTIVAGNSNIVDTAIKTDSTWSSKKISADLADKQDFRIFNSLEEFNEKKGTSLTVVSGVDNMKDIVNAMSNGEILIIITKYELGSEVYFGLTTDTGWTKMFTFVKSNGLCDVECRTTFPLTLKRLLNSDGVVGDWQELATMDKVESKYSEENVLTSTDWNTLNTKARYYFSGGTPMTNSPEEVPFGLLEVINVGSYCRIQRYFAFNGKLYIRRWSGNSWNEWYRFDGIAI